MKPLFSFLFLLSILSASSSTGPVEPSAPHPFLLLGQDKLNEFKDELTPNEASDLQNGKLPEARQSFFNRMINDSCITRNLKINEILLRDLEHDTMTSLRMIFKNCEMASRQGANIDRARKKDMMEKALYSQVVGFIDFILLKVVDGPSLPFNLKVKEFEGVDGLELFLRSVFSLSEDQIKQVFNRIIKSIFRSQLTLLRAEYVGRTGNTLIAIRTTKSVADFTDMAREVSIDEITKVIDEAVSVCPPHFGYIVSASSLLFYNQKMNSEETFGFGFTLRESGTTGSQLVSEGFVSYFMKALNNNDSNNANVTNDSGDEIIIASLISKDEFSIKAREYAESSHKTAMAITENVISGRMKVINYDAKSVEDLVRSIMGDSCDSADDGKRGKKNNRGRQQGRILNNKRAPAVSRNVSIEPVKAGNPKGDKDGNTRASKIVDHSLDNNVQKTDSDLTFLANHDSDLTFLANHDSGLTFLANHDRPGSRKPTAKKSDNSLNDPSSLDSNGTWQIVGKSAKPRNTNKNTPSTNSAPQNVQSSIKSKETRSSPKLSNKPGELPNSARVGAVIPTEALPSLPQSNNSQPKAEAGKLTSATAESPRSASNASNSNISVSGDKITPEATLTDNTRFLTFESLSDLPVDIERIESYMDRLAYYCGLVNDAPDQDPSHLFNFNFLNDDDDDSDFYDNFESFYHLPREEMAYGSDDQVAARFETIGKRVQSVLTEEWRLFKEHDIGIDWVTEPSI